jgi:hypothetical protein
MSISELDFADLDLRIEATRQQTVPLGAASDPAYCAPTAFPSCDGTCNSCPTQCCETERTGCYDTRVCD